MTILNPRREDWDDSWEQSKHEARFRTQVSWELEGLEACDLALIVFPAASKAPIALLELGLFVRRPRLIVCCEPGFYRAGNIEMVCERYRVSLETSLTKSLETVRRLVAAWPGLP